MSTAVTQTCENRTITVDFRDEATYVQLLGDGKAFVECVCAFLLSLGFQLAHKATGQGGGCLTRHSHYLRARLGGVTIWRIQLSLSRFLSGLMRRFGITIACQAARPRAALRFAELQARPMAF